ncbi:hypothetical protein GCM10010429_10350 [Micromonospora olivasterospora]
MRGDYRTITTGYQDLRIPLAANRVNRTTPGELHLDFWHGGSSTVQIEEIRFEQESRSHDQDKSPLPHWDRRRGTGHRSWPGRSPVASCPGQYDGSYGYAAHDNDGPDG